MRLLLLVLISSSFLAGCSHATKDFEALADRACACAEEDTACGSKVLADLVSFTEHTKTTDGDQSRMNAAGVRLNDCLSATGLKQADVTGALETMAVK